MISLKRKPRPEPSQVQGCDYGLVISCNPRFKNYYETLPLAKELARRGVNVLLSKEDWARDELLFQPDGRVEYVPCEHEQYKDFKLPPHEAYEGGKFLKGKGFIIASNSVAEEKRDQTALMLGADKSFYLDLRQAYDYFISHNRGISRHFFEDENGRHIDRLVNIGNTRKILFSYDAPVLREALRDVASETGYLQAFLPREESGFGAINFVELGDHVVVDKRAKGTIEMLEELGYDVIPTPRAMVFTNIKQGGVRCSCTEIPNHVYERIDFAPKRKWWQGEPALQDLEGRAVKIYAYKEYQPIREYVVPPHLLADLLASGADKPAKAQESQSRPHTLNTSSQPSYHYEA
jgi:hypothetical protein